MLIVNLHSAMVKLIKGIMVQYMPTATVKDCSEDELHKIKHTDRSLQLNDLDLFIGNEARLLLTTSEEEELPADIASFYK